MAEGRFFNIFPVIFLFRVILKSNILTIQEKEEQYGKILCAAGNDPA